MLGRNLFRWALVLSGIALLVVWVARTTADAPKEAMESSAGASIGVITGLSPAQVAALPIVLRTTVRGQLGEAPEFVAMPEAFRTQLMSNWNQMVSFKVLDAGSGTVMLQMTGAMAAADHRKAGDLLATVYLMRLQHDRENRSIELRRVYQEERARVENEMANIDKRINEMTRSREIVVGAAPSMPMRDALAQAKISLIHAQAQAQTQTQVTEEAARQVRTLEKTVEMLGPEAANERQKLIELASVQRQIQQLEGQYASTAAQRDAVDQKVADVRMADMTPGPVHLVSTAE